MNESYSAYWYRALSLKERMALSGEPVDSDIQLGQNRLRDWRQEAALEEDDFFAGYLNSLGINQQQFISLLGETDESLQKRTGHPPQWLEQLHQYYAHDCDLPPLSDEFKQQFEEYLLLVIAKPILLDAYQQLTSEIDELLVGVENPPFDRHWARDIFYYQFVAWVLWVLRRPIFLELHISRLEKTFSGETSAERFQAFIAYYEQNENALILLENYPVLARKMVEQVAIFKQAGVEFLDYLIKDYEELKRYFFDTELGHVINLNINLSDSHRGGRRVFKVTFSNGQQIIYKPKSLAIDQCYQDLLEFINAHNPPLVFKTVKVLDRGSYGWVECVIESPCQEQAELERFYQRQGMNMALLYTLNANDFHYENLIACGEHPILIDLETLYQPMITDASVSEVHSHLINSTVLSLGLLPYENGDVGNLKEEVGGFGGDSGQSVTVRKIVGINTDEMQFELQEITTVGAENLPKLDGKTADVREMVQPIVNGFTQMYEWLLEHSDLLLGDDGVLAAFKNIETRLIVRNTVKYTALANASWHPDYIQNALFKDRLFTKLWRQGFRNALFAEVSDYEVSDLEIGDVPVFNCISDSRDLKVNTAQWLPDILSKSGHEAVTERISAMCHADMRRQIWLIRGALEVPRDLSTLEEAPPSGLDRFKGCIFNPEECLEQALKVGERLAELMISDFGQTNWFDRVVGNADATANRLALMDAGLYSGLSGMMVFFEHLGRQSGSSRMLEISEQLLVVIDSYSEHPEKLDYMGASAYNGWPSMIYLYIHMGRLRHDDDLLKRAEHLFDGLKDQLANPEDFDLIGGVSGTILVLSQLAEVFDKPSIKQQVRYLADWLASNAVKQSTGVGWVNAVTQAEPLTGLGHGASGAILALTEAAICLKQPNYLNIVKQALAYEDSWFNEELQNWLDLRLDRMNEQQHDAFFAWCHGGAGIGLGRLACLQRLEQSGLTNDVDLLDGLRASVRVAAESTLTSGFGTTHCLCHGDLGNIELIMAAAEYFDDDTMRQQGRALSAQIVNSIQVDGYRCGSAQGREILALMMGLAGVGYGLLKLYNPKQIPSVLLLETAVVES